MNVSVVITFFHLVKEDIKDLLKVNIPGGATLKLMQYQPDIDVGPVNHAIQETGPSIILIMMILYSLFKLIDMFRKMRWNKQDRMEEVSDE